MDEAAIRQLNAATQRLYREHAASFARTREHPWDGWLSVLSALGPLWRADGEGREAEAGEAPDADLASGPGTAGEATAGNAPAPPAPRILDAACGTFRFADLLAARGLPAQVIGVDACPELAQGAALPGSCPAGQGRRFVERDLVEALLAGGDPFAGLPEAPFDAAVCFGFLHHLPSERLRERLLSCLVSAVRPGGFVAVSLWRFLADARLARKAQRDTARLADAAGLAGSRGALGEGDALLGWQDASDAARFCHSFSEGEACALIGAVSDRARLVARFRADGAAGELNEYLVLRALEGPGGAARPGEEAVMDREEQGKRELDVVGAALMEGGRMLAAQRATGEFAGGWEFPGGKIEPGESPEQALARELREELGIQARIGRLVAEVRHDYGHLAIHMRVYEARSESGEPQRLEHAAFAWVDRATIDGLAWLAADIDAIEQIKRAGILA